MRRDVVQALGIDVGSTNTKVALVEICTGDVWPQVVERSVVSGPTPATAPALVALVVDLIAKVVAAGPVPQAVGVASMAETGVPLGPDGAPLAPLLRWDVHRAAEEAQALASTYGSAALFAATGVRPSAKVPLATWAWLRAHEPEVAHRMTWWAGAADLVVLALTGELTTDHTLAGRTMAYRRIASAAPGHDRLPDRFDADLLDLVGLNPDRLPRVVAPDAIAGRLGRVPDAVAGRAGGAAGPGRFWADVPGVLAAAGLPLGTPVVAAGHDHAVGAWAAGVREPGDRVDSIGTAEAVLTVLDGAPDVVRTQAAGMSLVRTVSGRHEAVLAGSSSAGSMLGWLRDRLEEEGKGAGRERPGRHAGERAPDAGGRLPRKDLPGGASPDLLARALADAWVDLSAAPSPTDVVVLPYLAGRQSPAPDPTARVRVIGGPAHGARLTRATLEGLCLQVRWMLTEQAALGAPGRGEAPGPRPLAVLGGPATSDQAWAATKRRVQADPLRWVTAREPVATGAALLAATRAGLLGDDIGGLLGTGTFGAPTLPAHRTEADPGGYDAIYARFVEAALAEDHPADTAEDRADATPHGDRARRPTPGPAPTPGEP